MGWVTRTGNKIKTWFGRARQDEQFIPLEEGIPRKALSGGQQQKVALLRGLMKDSEIQLMDKITASLDSQSVTQIMQALEQCRGQKTRIMISHNLKEIKDSDKIMVLDKGKVIAQGTHDFLLQTCGLYQQLWKAYNTLTSTPKMMQGLGGSMPVDALEPVLMPDAGARDEFKVEGGATERFESAGDYVPPTQSVVI